MLSGTAMHRSRDGMLARLPPVHKSVVASTQAVGWQNIHGVITAGRLEDFFGWRKSECVAST